MNQQNEIRPELASAARSEHFDVLVVGAGISGIDAAYHLKTRLPDKTFAAIERAEGLGGTWRTHRFPGIRTDSDLYTFGYGWKPWMGKTLASAEEITAYLEEAVEEQALARFIRYGAALAAADWRETEKRWVLTTEDVATGARRTITCAFLWMCQGYYDHQNGYVPDFPGRERFAGPVIHPQHWPADLVTTGKRVAVIGSGATAATLVPALAKDAGHVTIVQRTPSYYFPRPKEHELAALLRPLDLPPEWFHEIMRRQMFRERVELMRRIAEEPDVIREEFMAAARAHLGDACPVEPHFSPSYTLWRQRVALIPEGDLFLAINRGDVSVETGEIETFTETGLTMKDGTGVEADIIVSATGLNLQMMGGVPFTIDGALHDFSKSWTHRAMMFTGVPNLAWVFGYIRASWTLRADLVSEFICRLLAHMDATGVTVAEPRLRPEDADMPALPFFDPEDFNPGYITRALDDLPRNGDRAPWIVSHDFDDERRSIPAASLTDGTIAYR